MKFKIRKLTSKDLPQLLKLFKTSLQEDFEEFQPTVALVYQKIFNRRYFKAFIKKRKNCILGAFQKGKLIGLFVMYGHGGGVMEYIWLIVNKQHRGRGVGSALLKEAEEWSLKHMFHHVYLHTMNLKLGEFYKMKGFEHVGQRRKLYFGIDEFMMQKVLRDKPFEEIFEKYLK